MRLVGIDCATQEAKIGVAFGDFRNGSLIVREVFACTKERSAADRISHWLRRGNRPALLAIDAPLGWPKPLSRALARHRAGEELRTEAHDMFRRETDRFIKRETGKTSLDVGADRIARTAHAALCLLRDLRRNLNLERIPLAWEWPPPTEISAIEVYPAATLISHGFLSSGYKRPEHVSTRRKIIKNLSSLAEFGDGVTKTMLESADGLDAVVCLVAAQDFLLGNAMSPENRGLAEVEGWIWTRKKA